MTAETHQEQLKRQVWLHLVKYPIGTKLPKGKARGNQTAVQPGQCLI